MKYDLILLIDFRHNMTDELGGVDDDVIGGVRGRFLEAICVQDIDFFGDTGRVGDVVTGYVEERIDDAPRASSSRYCRNSDRFFCSFRVS